MWVTSSPAMSSCWEGGELVLLLLLAATHELQAGRGCEVKDLMDAASLTPAVLCCLGVCAAGALSSGQGVGRTPGRLAKDVEVHCICALVNTGKLQASKSLLLVSGGWQLNCLFPAKVSF